jgi:hypothetical protein
MLFEERLQRLLEQPRISATALDDFSGLPIARERQ